MALYSGSGAMIEVTATAVPVDYDRTVKNVNHRGYSTIAPENTLPAYRLSKKMGFCYVECDVRFTSDGVAVLMHNATINGTARMSDGTALTETINIADITYEEASVYDYGIWKSSAYKGTKIPTVEEFILLCKNLGLHPYLEIKAGTEAQVQAMVDIVNRHGMRGKVSYIGGATFLNYVHAHDADARLGVVGGTVTETTVTWLQSAKTANNEVFMDAYYGNLTEESIGLCIAAGIPVEIWTVNDSATVLSMHPYVSGVTSDSLKAGKILLDANL